MAGTTPFLVALFICLVSGESMAGPPGGVDSLSPLALKTTPALASDVVLGGTMLGSVGAGAFAGLRQGDWRQLGSTAGVLLVTGGLTELTKRQVDRRRPYTWDPSYAAAGAADYCAGTAPVKPDACKSFYSGHTAMTAASSFSAVRSMHLSGSLESAQDRTVAYTSAALLTVIAGSLRVVAGKHYVSDVAVGALVGTTLGVFGPTLVY
jgi:membrane-associated phospholipid phosphatase